MARVEVLQGDITEVPSGAVVNAANPGLLAGGGVCGAIHAAAGPALADACRGIGHCGVGRAVVTPSFGLKASTGADFVIHAVGPRYIDGAHAEAERLASAYRSVVDAAVDLGVATVTTPSISTGIFRFPLDDAARIAVSTLRGSGPDTLVCKMVCFDDRTRDAYVRALG